MRRRSIRAPLERRRREEILSDEQRRDIMCRNAMRFLRLDESVCESRRTMR
jgi:hypothetical protein